MSYNYEDAWNNLRKELKSLKSNNLLRDLISGNFVDYIERRMEQLEGRLKNKD